MLYYGLERQDKRLKNAQSHVDKVKNKYGNDNVTVTGHLLGASISEQLARSSPNIYNYSIAFNRGSGLLQSFQKFNRYFKS